MQTNTQQPAEQPKTIRHLKVQYRNRISKSSFTGYKRVPEIRFNGVWLEEMGFHLQTQFSITAMRDVLIIRKL